jgi:hypothetical protein
LYPLPLETWRAVKDLLFFAAILSGFGTSICSFMIGSQAFFSERMALTRKRVITGCPAQLLGVACIFLAMVVTAGMLFALLVSIYGFPDASDFDPD